MKTKLAIEATNIAKKHFRKNILFSFIGGAYATGKFKPTSDIDIFVLLKKSDYKAEKEFAIEFKKFHGTNQLNFSHCGEIFDYSTLKYLLEVTEETMNLMPSILKTACYHADCILSIFRKGDIIMKFFLDPKVCVYGDIKLLRSFERRAKKYFKKNTTPRIQTEKGRLIIPEKGGYLYKCNVLKSKYEKMAKTDRYFDTPLGVGLQRWFSNILERRICPRIFFAEGSIEALVLKRQCLGSYYENFVNGYDK